MRQIPTTGLTIKSS